MARRGLSGAAIGVMLSELGAHVEAKAVSALAAGAEIILADAKSRINTGGTGRLAASGKIIKNKRGTILKITFDAADDKDYTYAKIVEFRPGHEKPYLYPAFDAHRNKTRQNVIDAIREAVRSNAVS